MKDLETKDIDGYTPLHLAIKSVEGLRSTRPVRALLMKGAKRDAVDLNGERPVDLVAQIGPEDLKRDLYKILKEPRSCECFMIKTPLKLMHKNVTTSLTFLGLILLSYFILTFLIFPCNL